MVLEDKYSQTSLQKMIADTAFPANRYGRNTGIIPGVWFVFVSWCCLQSQRAECIACVCMCKIVILVAELYDWYKYSSDFFFKHWNAYFHKRVTWFCRREVTCARSSVLPFNFFLNIYFQMHFHFLVNNNDTINLDNIAISDTQLANMMALLRLEFYKCQCTRFSICQCFS